MGALTVVLPLDPAAAVWAAETGAAVPAPLPPARDPTSREVIEALGPVAEFEIEGDPSGESWSARYRSTDGAGGPTWDFLRVQSEDAGRSCALCFPKGAPDVVVAFAERLARLCGPRVLVDDHRGEPFVVCAGDDVRRRARDWESL